MYEHLPVCKVSLLTPLAVRLVEVASIYHQILHPEHNRKQYIIKLPLFVFYIQGNISPVKFLAFCPHCQWVNT